MTSCSQPTVVTASHITTGPLAACEFTDFLSAGAKRHRCGRHVVLSHIDSAGLLAEQSGQRNPQPRIGELTVLTATEPTSPAPAHSGRQKARFALAMGC